MFCKKLKGIFIILSLAFIFSGCAKKPSADTIFYHGTILTVDKNMTEAQAVAIKDGKIITVGSEKEVLRHRGQATKMVDLKGKTLMPGFVETHSHPYEKMVIENFTTDIRPAFYRDGAEIMRVIKDRIANAKPGEYLVFFGWDPLVQKGLKNPTIQELDAMAPDNPLFIWGTVITSLL
ncbi:MAG: amidohydrolase family protein [Candidatus Omnitrophica bacterium]|nr:amidohydrolase family protein [Candidatus Omnitrophota bacterium]MCM8791124.1 amidohydrolase family protein [Candidatus Omnitrophota bacterium]